MNSAENVLLNKFKDAVRNHEQIHVLDERRVVCIFYNLFKQNGRLDVEEIDRVIKGLPSEYSDDIAYVISMLAVFCVVLLSVGMTLMM
jgi:hypothetical protein